MEKMLFFTSFLKYPKETGSAIPSSKFLTREIIKNIDFKNSYCIVELGPGLGTFTKPILRRSKLEAKLICFEINKKFCNYLDAKINDNRLVLINEGAENIKRNLGRLGIKTADCIVSGLPFRNFTDAKKRRILMEVSKSLKKGGRFVLFQYTNGLADMLGSYFQKVERKFVPLNMPPSFVYICEK